MPPFLASRYLEEPFALTLMFPFVDWCPCESSYDLGLAVSEGSIAKALYSQTLGVSRQESWTTEFGRRTFLLHPI